ncbi:hypothetical protein [Polaromonas sp. UBA4122]|uniref:hypothetical protein n=1 Tax=Polaromonas sp. UBA4122 TaxID=1947074 RepID=UPI0025FE576C|nr:hypothetical protein [Polaromonas sp. UBA4122]
MFIAEFPLKTAFKTNISVDGVLLHELRMPLGYWEAITQLLRVTTVSVETARITEAMKTVKCQSLG